MSATSISIVVPTFDAAPYLKPLYDSIVNSALATAAKEIIFVCEGHGDNSREILADLAKTSPIPIDIFSPTEAVEDLLVRAEHGVINEVDLAVVADSATFHAWTVMPIFQRIAYCQAAQAHIGWALRAPPPPYTLRSLRVLVENHARTNHRLGGIEF